MDGATDRRERWGHPAGLGPLFFTELWERFSYYGMRGLLILYMTASVDDGGLGYDTAHAGAVYGLYAGLVYLACLPGGLFADRISGSFNATVLGGTVILAGHLCLALPGTVAFVPGLGLLVLGTGLLKPNVSTMVGQLYAGDDPRRDAGYSIYYMGINLGAFIAPLVCGWLALGEPFRARLQAAGFAPQSAWHWGFGAAAVGMAIGLGCLLRGAHHYGAVSRRPTQPPGPRERRSLATALIALGATVALTAGLLVAGRITLQQLSDLFGIALLVCTLGFFAWVYLTPGWTQSERANLRVIVALFLAAVVFWSVGDQAGSTLNLFAERDVDRHLPWLGIEFPATWFLSLNPLLVIGLAPLFAALWVRLGPRNPSSIVKFMLGLVFAAGGFAVLIAAAHFTQTGAKVSPSWLVATYALATIGELCLSPVGLSAMSRLAPARIASLTMGVWFLASAIGGYLSGRAASYYDTLSLTELFTRITSIAMAAVVILGVMLFVFKPAARHAAE
jgi:POT family proton-dependent oligopeptide transporter